jgi:hypothetical protein
MEVILLLWDQEEEYLRKRKDGIVVANSIPLKNKWGEIYKFEKIRSATCRETQFTMGKFDFHLNIFRIRKECRYDRRITVPSCLSVCLYDLTRSQTSTLLISVCL